MAAGRRAGARDRQHLVERHEGARAAPRRPGERAVAADVAAEHGQRDEDLRRVGDEPVPAPPAAGLFEQLLERGGEQLVHLVDSIGHVPVPFPFRLRDLAGIA